MNNYQIAKQHLENIKDKVSNKSQSFGDKECNKDYMELLEIISFGEEMEK